MSAPHSAHERMAVVTFTPPPLSTVAAIRLRT